MKLRPVILQPHKPESRSERAERRHVNMLRSSPFRFLDLPSEIRNSVYRLCLVDQENIRIEYTEQSYGDAITFRRALINGKFAARPLGTKILFLCTMIYHEASAILYGCNTFEFTEHLDDRMWEKLIRFSSRLTDVSRKSMRELVLNCKTSWLFTGPRSSQYLAKSWMSGAVTGESQHLHEVLLQDDHEYSDSSEVHLQGVCTLSDTTSIKIHKTSLHGPPGAPFRVWIYPTQIGRLLECGWEVKVESDAEEPILIA